MKKLLGLLLIVGCPVLAQHSVTLSCTPSLNAVSSSSVNLYRYNMSCASAVLATSTTAYQTGLPNNCSFVDTAVTAGVYCYKVTAIIGGIESGFSSPIEVNIPTANKVNILKRAWTVFHEYGKR